MVLCEGKTKGAMHLPEDVSKMRSPIDTQVQLGEKFPLKLWFISLQKMQIWQNQNIL